MNKERLIAIRDLIKENPKLLYMKAYAVEDYFNTEIRYDNISPLSAEDINIKLKQSHICKTSKCIAGWACCFYDNNFKNRHENRNYSYYDVAREILDLSEEEAENLFFADENIVLYILEDYINSEY